ncbi:MAG: sugar phosphate isomerase/epimerase, partial [Planctomycetes bacterium]|nr:sugar phosphate isomerase/epimerase [Planctomycetota bacterium]
PSGVGPGMGDQEFVEPLRALRASGYRGWISVEPFVYEPDPETVARTAIETIRRALAQAA